MKYTVALKIDVDTYRGAKYGIPTLLDVLESHGVRSTFFMSFGPDYSGKAVARVFRKRGFLGKMARTNPAKCYGLDSMLRGVVLPPVQIGRRCADRVLAIRQAGHEVAVHAWNHVRWQDDLPRMTTEQIRGELRRACDCYEDILGIRPLACGAPGWICTSKSLAVQDTFAFRYCSDTRGTEPFFPIRTGRAFRTLQIPTTLPTLDEEIGRNGADARAIHARLVSLLRDDKVNVYTLHAETEGMAFARDFASLLAMMRERNVRFVTLGEAADRLLADPGAVATCDVQMRTIPGRAGLVACQAGRV